MRYILVNGRMPAPDAFCALCTEKIGETYCREIDTRLLYCARPRISRTGGQLMTKRCAHCLGGLGLISHRSGSWRFCKAACKKAWKRAQEEERRAKIRWLGFLARASPS
jgi:hypothetical protein